MRDLSILIPARNELYLQNTLTDILAHIEGDTEIIVVLDGYWPYESIADDPRITIIHHSASVGQRRAVNEAAALSRAKYIMKVDAHCSFDQGFDKKLIADFPGPECTVVPRMYNLHVFDWVCKSCNGRTYQGPTPKQCKCGGIDFEREMKWQPRWHRRTDFAYFDKDMVFQYWIAYSFRHEGIPAISDVMTCVGACWMMERRRYIELDGLDEGHGSWGQMGTEIACKSWLSGGRMVVNKKTWFSHLFRTQGGDFSWPYPIGSSQIDHAREHSRNLWLGDNWPKATRKLSWLIEKFAPVPTWS
jgi:glycosyltransferase involved in cell wall biosynthesis